MINPELSPQEPSKESASTLPVEYTAYTIATPFAPKASPVTLFENKAVISVDCDRAQRSKNSAYIHVPGLGLTALDMPFLSSGKYKSRIRFVVDRGAAKKQGFKDNMALYQDSIVAEDEYALREEQYRQWQEDLARLEERRAEVEEIVLAQPEIVPGTVIREGDVVISVSSFFTTLVDVKHWSGTTPVIAETPEVEAHYKSASMQARIQRKRIGWHGIELVTPDSKGYDEQHCSSKPGEEGTLNVAVRLAPMKHGYSQFPQLVPFPATAQPPEIEGDDIIQRISCVTPIGTVEHKMLIATAREVRVGMYIVNLGDKEDEYAASFSKRTLYPAWGDSREKLGILMNELRITAFARQGIKPEDIAILEGSKINHQEGSEQSPPQDPIAEFAATLELLTNAKLFERPVSHSQRVARVLQALGTGPERYTRTLMCRTEETGAYSSRLIRRFATVYGPDGTLVEETPIDGIPHFVSPQVSVASEIEVLQNVVSKLEADFLPRVEGLNPALPEVVIGERIREILSRVQETLRMQAEAVPAEIRVLEQMPPLEVKLQSGSYPAYQNMHSVFDLYRADYGTETEVRQMRLRKKAMVKAGAITPQLYIHMRDRITSPYRDQTPRGPVYLAELDELWQEIANERGGSYYAFELLNRPDGSPAEIRERVANAGVAQLQLSEQGVPQFFIGDLNGTISPLEGSFKLTGPARYGNNNIHFLEFSTADYTRYTIRLDVNSEEYGAIKAAISNSSSGYGSTRDIAEIAKYLSGSTTEQTEQPEEPTGLTNATSDGQDQWSQQADETRGQVRREAPPSPEALLTKEIYKAVKQGSAELQALLESVTQEPSTVRKILTTLIRDSKSTTSSTHSYHELLKAMRVHYLAWIGLPKELVAVVPAGLRSEMIARLKEEMLKEKNVPEPEALKALHLLVIPKYLARFALTHELAGAMNINEQEELIKRVHSRLETLGEIPSLATLVTIIEEELFN